MKVLARYYPNTYPVARRRQPAVRTRTWDIIILIKTRASTSRYWQVSQGVCATGFQFFAATVALGLLFSFCRPRLHGAIDLKIEPQNPVFSSVPGVGELQLRADGEFVNNDY